MDDIKEPAERDEHVETGIQHTEGEQNTGNHKLPEGSDVERADNMTGSDGDSRSPVINIEQSTDVDRVADLDEQLEDSVSVNGPTERTAERDEHGRL